MQAQGAPQHIIDAYVKAAAATSAEAEPALWPQHVAPVRALFACGSQWRTAGSMAGVLVTGLDYGACDMALRHAGIALDQQGFQDFQTLESHARDLLNGTKPAELLRS